MLYLSKKQITPYKLLLKFDLSQQKYQAPVVQGLNNVVHGKNSYLVDKC